MSKSLTLGSFFDGIGGWLLAARHTGVNPVWASEIDDFPAAVTAHHFPQVKQLGDTRSQFEKILREGNVDVDNVIID